jgi:hypothetical protein
MVATLEKKSRLFPVAEDRVWPRLQCDLVTECIAFGRRWPCKIVDLSERGFGIISGVKLRIGDTVNIADPSAKAQVVWAENGRAGLKVFN